MRIGYAASSPRRAGWTPLALALALLLAAPALAQDGRALWTDLDGRAIPLVGERHIVPTAYRALAVDAEGLSAHLAAAPLEGRPGDLAAGITLALPLPDGRFETYRLVEAPVMAPGLQARFPAIRTYLGQGIEDPRASLRLSVTPQGVHAVSRTSEGVFYIDPFSQFDRQHVVAYWRRDAARAHDHDHDRPADTVIDDLGVGEEIAALIAQRDAEGGSRFEHGAVLRTHRIAIAATAQYTIFHSADNQNPTVEEGLAAVVVALNRVNEIYERDVAVRMELVENNDKLIYTDTNNQPYTNSNGFTMLGQNQSNVDALIGNANYDIGHVFSTGGGGVAGLGVVCRTGNKARGVTGLPQPINDPFYIDYVAHEIGHQYAANHTFNGSSGSCGGSNRNPSTAYEPGSGSTIMAYAGICGGHNIANRSDAYFHNISLTEIITFVTNSFGGTCGTTVDTENEVPDVILPASVSVPMGTPFRLTGGGTDDGPEEMLTYTWEAMNLGPAGAPPPTPGWNDTPPYFRSYLPEAMPTRFFPRLERFTVGQGIFGEGLPQSTQILRFRLTVRDNNPGAGAVRDRQVLIPVNADAGPFRVTSQATAGDAVTWAGGDEKEITWDVAGTNTATFRGETVDILLSLDRHLPFQADTALVLAEGVPNDGSATITVPSGYTSTRARVFVRASEGYFYAVNSRDISVSPGTSSADDAASPRATTLSAVYPNPMTAGRATVNLTLGEAQGQAVRVAVYDALGREVAVLHDGPLAGGANHQLTLEGQTLAAGVYYVRATGERFALVQPMTVVR